MELVIKEGTQAGKTLLADTGKEVLSLGRNSDNDLVIADTMASRHHARILLQGTEAILEDNNSANGLILNGQRVTMPIPLKNGDQIKIGQTVMEVQGLAAIPEAETTQKVDMFGPTEVNQAVNYPPRNTTPTEKYSAGTDAALPLIERSYNSQKPSAGYGQFGAPAQYAGGPGQANLSPPNEATEVVGYHPPPNPASDPAYEPTQFAKYRPTEATPPGAYTPPTINTPPGADTPPGNYEATWVASQIPPATQNYTTPATAYNQYQPAYNPPPPTTPSFTQGYNQGTPGYNQGAPAYNQGTQGYNQGQYYSPPPPVPPQSPPPSKKTGLWLSIIGIAVLFIIVVALLVLVLNNNKGTQVSVVPTATIGSGTPVATTSGSNTTPSVAATTAPATTAIVATTSAVLPTATAASTTAASTTAAATPTIAPTATATSAPTKTPAPTTNPSSQASALNKDADSLYDSGDYEEALVKYQAAIALDSKNPVYHNSAGFTLIKLKRNAEAVKELKAASDLDPNDPRYLGDLGYGYYINAQYDEAEKTLLATIQKDPTRALAIRDLGLVYMARQQYSKAVDQFLKATQLAPNVSSYYVSLGSAYYRLQKYPQSDDAFKKAAELDPKNGDAFNGRGNVSYSLGKYQEALTYYLQATNLNPNVAVFFTNLADTYLKLNDSPNARNAAQKALDIDPTNADAQNILNQAGG
jgi:superkiller protein 3